MKKNKKYSPGEQLEIEFEEKVDKETKTIFISFEEEMKRKKEENNQKIIDYILKNGKSF